MQSKIELLQKYTIVTQTDFNNITFTIYAIVLFMHTYKLHYIFTSLFSTPSILG